MMERVAERAATDGDVEQEAEAYIELAFIAQATDRRDLVPDLLRKTRALLDSPTLPAERRAALLKRIGGEPRLAGTRGRP